MIDAEEIAILKDQIEELSSKYDELNDFNNSQVKKLLEKNAELEEQFKEVETENIELDAEHQRFVDFVSTNYPSVAFEYITKRAKENGATVVKI